MTQRNRVAIPAEVARQLGIKPGWRLDWQPVEGKEEILVRVIPDRAELARRLLGSGCKYSPERDAVAELVAERAADDLMSLCGIVKPAAKGVTLEDMEEAIRQGATGERSPSIPMSS